MAGCDMVGHYSHVSRIPVFFLKHRKETMKYRLWALAALLMASGLARAEVITLATYNVEVFHEHFLAATRPTLDNDLAKRLKNDADKDNWEIGQVILDPKFSPDVLVIEECC